VKYAALRRASRPGGFTRRWPVTAPRDYPGGHVGSARVVRAAAAYFYLNRGWSRARHLLSHLRVTWGSAGWVVRVFYVDARRRRPRRVGRGRSGWVRSRGAAPYLAGVATRWARSRPAGWVWCRLPGLFEGNLDTLVAHLVYRLRGRFERRTKSVALPLLRLTQKMPGVVGARVRCHGRFTRRQRADRSTHKWGRLGRTHLGARVEDARATTALRFGAVGVTLLVNYGGDA
jgi:hypothetical protein